MVTQRTLIEGEGKKGSERERERPAGACWWFKAGNSLASHRHGRIQHRPASPREECLAHIRLILAPEVGFTQPSRPSPRSLPPCQGAGRRGEKRKPAPPASPREEAPFVKSIYVFPSGSWKRLAKQRLAVTRVPAPLWKTCACSRLRESIKRGIIERRWTISNYRLSVPEKTPARKLRPC